MHVFHKLKNHKYRHFVSFHCNRDCVGLQVYNPGTGTEYSHTHPAEFHIQVECPQNSLVSGSYCSL